MGLPFHTHTFEVPEATQTEVDNFLQVQAFVTPDKLSGFITTATVVAGYQPLDADLTAIAALSPSNDDFVQRKAGAWTNRTVAQVLTDLAAAGTTFQPLDSDLTAISALTPSNDDVLQRKAGVWTNRTIAQLLTDLSIAGSYQPLDTDLTAIAALTSAADKVPYATGAGTWALADFTTAGRNLVDDASADAQLTTLGLTANGKSLVTAADYAAMRALLDLEVGTDFLSPAAIAAAYQPLDADLTTLAGLTATTDNFIVSVASAWASRTPSQVRTTLGLVVGTDVQAYDAELAALAGLTSAADKVPYFTGSGTADVTTVTSFMRTVLDDTDAATALATLTVTGKHGLWIPSGAMVSRTTNGAASGSSEMATNKNMFKTLDFDTTTQEFAQFAIRMPKQWNESTVTFAPVWSHASTTTNFGVVWGLAGVAISNDDAGDVAFGTAQTSTDTGGTTNDIYEGPESSAITIAGTPAAGDYVMFQINRTVSAGSDTMAIDARLHGIVLFITTDAGNDA